MSTIDYRLAPRPAGGTRVPHLDEHQRRVVEHPGGPLLVLAGPGTGKTTTLVEAIVDRVERRGASPESVLALTFSRRAAEQLRDRVIARLGRTVSTSLSTTFHSFAYSLVRRYDAETPHATRPPLRLLSAPEQEVLLRDLLTSSEHAVTWPPSLAEARRTRGFAREVAALVARAVERGIGYERLASIGEREGRPELVSAAAFMQQYDDVLGSRNMIDYSGLIATAAGILQDPAQPAREEMRARFRHVFVDEYQDTDPSQVALLQSLVAPGAELVVVGDPHQSIYAFRGAEVRGILEFPTRFPGADGAPAPVVALGTTRRFGPHLLAAAQRVAARLPLPGTIDGAARAAFAAPRADDAAPPGVVQIRTFENERAEAEHLADLLRRAHLEDGVPWGEMAVLVRSARSTVPGLRRALVAAGVPVAVSSDETPLSQEPAVLPLIEALHVVADPDHLDADRAETLLLSPLVGADAVELRALARALRARERESGVVARPSAALIEEALRAPHVLDGVESAAVHRVRAFTELVGRARQRLEAGGSLEEVLWELWDGTSWPARLQAGVAAGGGAARLAHRDLDAVCALFDYAGRAQEHLGAGGVVEFLEQLRAQQIPADTLVEQGARGDAVRLMTAHRSKGLEWRLVVVAHVQEQAWPDLRLRTSLLRADELGHDGLVERPTARALLAEERRLFYVACTRARERLVVTAVASTADDGEEASRFLGELAADPADVVHVVGRPARPLSLAGLVAELRRTCADEEVAEPVRRAAAARLARLAAAEHQGRPLVPAAHPGTWWGTRALSRAEAPLLAADTPVRITASMLTAIERCPLRWFLERRAGGEQTGNQGQGFGNVVHALADRLGSGELDGPPEAVVDGLMEHLDRVWSEIPFRTPWSAALEREAARAALVRYLHWLDRARSRERVATEQDFEAQVVLDDGTRATLHGRADRLEIDAEGRVVVVDLKTTKYPPADKDVPADPQLGLYQLAVENGGFDAVLPEDARPGRPGGAELWQLRKESRGLLKVQAQDPLPSGGEEPRLIDEQIRTAVELVREEAFPTRPEKQQCDRCDFRPMCPSWNSQGVVS